MTHHTTTDVGPPSGGGPRRAEERGQIDLHGDLHYWLKALDTTHERLLEAVAAVGTDAIDVASYLRRGSDAEPPPVEQRPDGG
jgi:hypothetical protein